MRLLGCLLVILSSLSVAAENYERWHDEVEQKLRSDSGWLTVVGLHWLKEGKNSLGSDFKNDLRLPKSAKSELGYIQKTADTYRLVLNNKKDVLVDGKTPSSLNIEIQSDVSGEPSVLNHKNIQFFLVTRKNGTGLRVKDPNSEARKNFKGRKWLPVNEDLVLKGKWIPLEKPKTIIVPDVIGNMNEELATGYVEFTYRNKRQKLYPSSDSNELFIVFKDQTSGKSTYGNARFLYAPKDKDNSVILDFNKAVNPPCAFTDYATCPKAPKENILPFEVQAGELPPTSKI